MSQKRGSLRGLVIAHVHSGEDIRDVELQVRYNVSYGCYNIELPNGDWFQVTKELMDDVYRQTRTKPE